MTRAIRWAMFVTMSTVLLPLVMGGRSRAGEATPATDHDPDRDRARTYLLMRLTEELELSDEKGLELAKVLRVLDEQRRELRTKRRDVEERIRTSVVKTPVDSGGLGKLIDEANGVDHELAMLQERVSLEVQKLLSLEQRARLVLIRPQLQREVQGQHRPMERDEGRRRPDEGRAAGRGRPPADAAD